MISTISLRPELRRLRCLSFKTESKDRDKRGEEDFGVQRTPSEGGFRILDWFEKITKSGLGLQGTQWPAYIHGELCYQ
jgi:hypothetical protein